MADDERAALRLAHAHRALVEDRARAHGGRVVKEMGDGLLVVFGSAVESAEAALEVLGALATDAAEIPGAGRLNLRMAIHVGDVVERGHDVMGDAVNIASRIHALGQPGQLLVSRETMQHLGGRLELEAVSMGAHELKNVTSPMEVFSVKNSREIPLEFLTPLLDLLRRAAAPRGLLGLVPPAQRRHVPRPVSYVLEKPWRALFLPLFVLIVVLCLHKALMSGGLAVTPGWYPALTTAEDATKWEAMAATSWPPVFAPLPSGDKQSVFDSGGFAIRPDRGHVAIVSRQDYYGDLRLRFRAKSIEPATSNINFAFCSPDPTIGLFISLGGWSNSRSGILEGLGGRELLTTEDFRLSPDRWYSVDATLRDGTLTVMVDSVVVLSLNIGNEHKEVAHRVAFATEDVSAVEIDDVRIDVWCNGDVAARVGDGTTSAALLARRVERLRVIEGELSHSPDSAASAVLNCDAARLLEALGRPDDARLHYEQAIKSGTDDENSYRAASALAAQHIRQGRTGAAMDWVGKAMAARYGALLLEDAIREWGRAALESIRADDTATAGRAVRMLEAIAGEIPDKSRRQSLLPSLLLAWDAAARAADTPTVDRSLMACANGLLGSQPSTVYTVVNRLLVLRFDSGDRTGALAALAEIRERLGPRSPYYASAVDYAASCLLQLGDTPTARRMFSEVVERFTGAQHEGNFPAAWSLLRLAEIAHDEGHAADAGQYLARLEREYPEAHYQVTDATILRARIAIAAGRSDLAEPLLRAVVADPRAGTKRRETARALLSAAR